MTGPRNARKTTAGRSYVWTGPDGETETFTSVTTILGAVLAKPALPRWAAKVCAEYTVEKFGSLAAMMRSGDRDAVVSMIKQAPWTARDRAADRGTLVHALAEAVSLDQTPTVPEELRGYIAMWSAWVDSFSVKFEAAEATVYHRGLGYAGTLDAIVECDIPGEGRQRVLIDLKTGRDVYPEASLQLTAYRYAEFMGLPDGTEAPMPEVFGTYVLHLMEDDFDFVPVRSDKGQRLDWEAVVQLHEWTRRKDLIGASLGSFAGKRLL